MDSNQVAIGILKAVAVLLFLWVGAAFLAQIIIPKPLTTHEQNLKNVQDSLKKLDEAICQADPKRESCQRP
ncbi:hypothetical protein H6G80_03980 [Nostoc sp. FACHB-87]|uniref:hypothetical protein n=1 Tax=Nostocaceae TaxID=1162 RepID=UPI001682668E|nr:MULTISPECIES: hypothetical protein [Nostocaceae]MBD2453234.1 hypothetical protein [Nostoc sp. FACHB-87]MBD2474986.1 hypothetical protein [Anabaena sp. FACHB-83]